MGNTVIHSFLRSSVPVKRKAHAIDHDLSESDSEDYILSPKRRKIMSTTKYVYKTLFLEEQGSDIKIVALNRTWNLHRLYLSQSPYFNSMFNGIWLETNQKEIHIGIEDENITACALHKVFGSFYQDEIHINPLEAVSILACATLLQLDDIILQCVEVMKESIYKETVISYYEAAELYGLAEIKASSLDWLYKNTLLTLSPQYLLQISCDLMSEIVSSHKLVVIQTEFSLYLLLKNWVFLKENSSFTNFSTISQAAEEYFSEIKSDVPFLSKDIGAPYLKAFRALRLQHLVIHHVDMEIIEADKIIPVDWFMPIFKIQWYKMLRVDQGTDKGPKQVSEEDFNRDCVRCGRVLQTDSQHGWRWTGFHFGFDIVITYKSGCFKLQRYQISDSDTNIVFQNHMQIISLRSKKRHLMYRLGVYSLDKNGKTQMKGETGIETVTLKENEKITVLTFQQELQFPILLSANFLLATPVHSTDDIIPSGIRTSELYV